MRKEEKSRMSEGYVRLRRGAAQAKDRGMAQQRVQWWVGEA